MDAKTVEEHHAEMLEKLKVIKNACKKFQEVFTEMKKSEENSKYVYQRPTN